MSLIDRRIGAAAQMLWAENGRDRRRARSHARQELRAILAAPLAGDAATVDGIIAAWCGEMSENDRELIRAAGLAAAAAAEAVD